jgi:formylglycine-generating enzyme required for sulfatase activity
MRYRYPGIKPFSEQDKDIFFGRATDISQLFDLISLEQSVLLYAKSGIGKSSLLNAGIYPLLAEKTNYKPLNVRFTAFVSESQSAPPLQTFQAKLPESPLHFVFKQLGIKNSLWTHFKSLQMTNPNQQYLLVFDQFEELFSYPEAQVQEFAKALSELLYTQVPQEVREKLEEMTSLFPDFLSEKEKENLLTPLAVKVVFSIRADRMSQLNQVKTHLPNLLRISYELKTLSNAQAIEAITTPAQKEGDFLSPKFSYEDKAMTQIMDYLTQKGKKNVETFQLQMICQHMESKIVIGNKDNYVETKDIGDLELITEDYYNGVVNQLGSKQEKNKIRIFIEEKLIVEDRRISLDEAICKTHIPLDTLKRLVDSRILRSEPNTTGGFSYELSHDTLVAPILKAKEVRIAEEQRQAEERKAQAEAEAERQRLAQERIEKEKQLKRQRTIISIVSVAAVISLLLAAFALWQMDKASKATALAEQSLREIEKNQKRLKIAFAEAEKQEQIILAQKDTAKAREQEAIIAKLQAEKAKAAVQAQLDQIRKKDQLQLSTYADNVGKALARYDISEARREMEKIRQTQIAPKDLLARLEKQIADTVQTLMPDMVKVEVGTFMMGCDTLVDKCGDDATQHQVTLNTYHIGKYEVTQALWQKVMGNNPAYFKPPAYPSCPTCPVETVSRSEVQEFIEKLNEKTGKKYRLPTEAEWEYAARGGKQSKAKTPLSSGGAVHTEGQGVGHGFIYAGTTENLDDYAWYIKNSDRKTHPVGTKKPNELGIYDMSGNVWEWCEDFYDENFYTKVKNGKANHPDKNRANYIVLRGGSWYNDAGLCRVAYRGWDNPTYRGYIYGFRIVLPVN